MTDKPLYFTGRLKNHRIAQVGRDLEKLSGLTFCEKGNLYEIISHPVQLLLKTFSDGDSAMSLGCCPSGLRHALVRYLGKLIDCIFLPFPKNNKTSRQL